MSKHLSRSAQRAKMRKERKLIERAAKKASSTAVRISTALQLSMQIVHGNSVVVYEADGTKKILKKIVPVKSNVYLDKGVKICLQPKD